MKTINLILLFIILFIQVNANTSKVDSILQNIERTLNAPSSGHYIVDLELIDKNNNTTIKTIEIYQKGNDKKIGKFLSPPMDKGFGFLSLPNNEMYIYMPAYNKIKKIVSNKKNGKFAGTDFTYKDMESTSFKDQYDAEILNEDSLYYTLKLMSKDKNEDIYKYVVITVSKDKYYPKTIKYFDKKEKHVKTLTIQKIENIDGYNVATISIMEDLKTKHKTIMRIKEAKFNIELNDDIFTKRFLKEQ